MTPFRFVFIALVLLAPFAACDSTPVPGTATSKGRLADYDGPVDTIPMRTADGRDTILLRRRGVGGIATSADTGGALFGQHSLGGVWRSVGWGRGVVTLMLRPDAGTGELRLDFDGSSPTLARELAVDVRRDVPPYQFVISGVDAPTNYVTLNPLGDGRARVVVTTPEVGFSHELDSLALSTSGVYRRIAP